jgi:hypothetical protein
MKLHHQMMAFMILAVAIVGYVVYPRIMEPFKGKGKGKGNDKGNDKGKLLFNGSYPSPPVVCLAGNSKIPCTAFSSG